MSRFDQAEQIAAYEELRPRCERFTSRLSELAQLLVTRDGVKIHAVESRTKETASFAEKIVRPGKNYSDPINEIRDFSALRLILYYPEDVERVCRIIAEEFTVDEENSFDRLSTLKPHEFGYRSVHYIVSLSQNRVSLPEWTEFTNMWAEIQVRTVLQHAWAAIAHELHYKHESEVPHAFSRRLYRLAGLLELGDQEFAAVRQAKDSFQKAVTARIQQGELQLRIDHTSLTEYIQHSSLARSLYEAALTMGFAASADPSGSRTRDHISALVWASKKADIQTIYDLDTLVRDAAIRQALFLKTLISKSEEAGSSEWSVTPAFVVLLFVFFARVDCFTPQVLRDRGWGEEAATWVLESCKEARDVSS
jgi:ppGpp synthetase/RelA/SpoT-type nucleotidyltranferase